MRRWSSERVRRRERRDAMMLDVDLREEEKRMMIPGPPKAHSSPSWAERKRSFPRWEGDDGLAVDDEDAFETSRAASRRAPSWSLTRKPNIFATTNVTLRRMTTALEQIPETPRAATSRRESVARSAAHARARRRYQLARTQAPLSF